MPLSPGEMTRLRAIDARLTASDPALAAGLRELRVPGQREPGPLEECASIGPGQAAGGRGRASGQALLLIGGFVVALCLLVLLPETRGTPGERAQLPTGAVDGGRGTGTDPYPRAVVRPAERTDGPVPAPK